MPERLPHRASGFPILMLDQPEGNSFAERIVLAACFRRDIRPLAGRLFRKAVTSRRKWIDSIEPLRGGT